METRRATPADRSAIAALLEADGLAPLPATVPLSNVLVARRDGDVQGVVVLEVGVRKGLLRSLAVAGAHREDGTRKSLVRSVIARAHELGLRELYLATDEEGDFFDVFGFHPVTPDDLPPEVRSMAGIRERTAAGARILRLDLETRL